MTHCRSRHVQTSFVFVAVRNQNNSLGTVFRHLCQRHIDGVFQIGCLCIDIRKQSGEGDFLGNKLFDSCVSAESDHADIIMSSLCFNGIMNKSGNLVLTLFNGVGNIHQKDCGNIFTDNLKSNSG